MITNLTVRNFQSLRLVDLELGLFTVIVGPSSSGKSAVIRACRALVSNVRGIGMITRGQKAMAITATLDTGAKVSLEREERASAYRITGDGTHQFTKLGGEVPIKVTETLRLDPGRDSLNFAAQFDRPFLLDESGATVAHVLGELTNVTTIFEAVRQANRVRQTAQLSLKNRRADLDQVRTRLVPFQSLPDKLQAFARVEQLAAERKSLTTQIERLDIAVRAVRFANSVVNRAQPREAPDPRPLQDAVSRLHTLEVALRHVQTTNSRLRAAQADYEERAATVSTLSERLTAMAADLKVCPTCGQSINHLDGPAGA